MIVFGELQSKHFIGGVESVELCKILLGRWGKQCPGESIHYFQVQGVHLQGPSVVFIHRALVHCFRRSFIYLCFQDKCVTRNFSGYRVKSAWDSH